MKLTAFILLIGCLHATAHGVAQDRITFSGDEVTLKKVFTVIKKQTSYLFLYNDELLQHAKKVSINVRNASVEEVLAMILKDQPFDFTIKGKTIFIINKPEPEKKDLPSMDGVPLVDELKGRITNAQGEPLGGANIVIKRTGKGTQANANGEFTLHNINADEIITISYTGYAQQTVKIGGRTNLILVMQVTDNELDEAIVQAYGTTTRRLSTSNIAKVTAAEIERQPVMNPLLALQGRVPGLEIKQLNGYATAPIKVELRGRNALNNDFTSDPLYIIDGVPLTVLGIGETTSYASGSSGFIQNGFRAPSGGQNPLFSINPADVESIEILKDADATAIYGSRGANGVILITTKKGKAGKTKFDLNIQQGATKVTRYYNMLNTKEYIAMRHEAFANDSLVPDDGNAYDLLAWDTTRYTDWQRILYGGTGRATNIQGSISGADSRTSFRIGVGYSRNMNILAVSGADQRTSISLNLNHASHNQRLRIALSSGYSFSKSDMINLPGKITYAPDAPAIYDSAGNLNFAGWSGKTNSVAARKAYPFGALKQPYSSKTGFLNSSLTISYQLLKGLRLRSAFGYNEAQSNQEYFQLIASQDPATNPKGGAQFGYNSNRNWIIEPQIDYDLFIGRGKTNVLIGATVQGTNTNGSRVEGSDYTSDDLIMSIANAPIKDAYDFYGEYKYAAVFGRINYNLANKYILNLTLRRDGSSRFGLDKHFGNFGSVGAAWIFSEEDWIKNSLKFLSYGKIRASYGTTGSDGIGDYGYLTRWSSNGTRPYYNSSSLVAIQHANDQYHWQTNKKLETAIDFGFLQDRLLLSLVYYRNRCGDQLVSYPTASFTGFSNVVANSPALVQNSGLEVSVVAHILKSKNFRWSFNFNIGINRNKLLAYPDFLLSPYVDQYIVGEPLNIMKVLRYTGVDPTSGNYSFEDKDKNGQTTIKYDGTADDRYPVDLTPKYAGGMGMNFSYKSCQLSLFFSFVNQKGINSLASILPGLLNLNQPIDVLKRWQTPGDIAEIAKFTTGGAAYQNQNNFLTLSDGIYTNASFIRLTNLSFSYSLPEKWIKKAGMKGCSIFFNTNNLLTISKYKGVDPETQNFGGLPPTRTMTGGLNFNF